MKVLTAQQTANRLGITRQRVCQHIKQGRLQAHRFGKQWLILQPEVDRFKPNANGRPKKVR